MKAFSQNRTTIDFTTVFRSIEILATCFDTASASSRGISTPLNTPMFGSVINGKAGVHFLSLDATDSERFDSRFCRMVARAGGPAATNRNDNELR
jgi:hypothetical protein